MIPAQIDFFTWSNSDYVEEFRITNQGIPVDLTGASMRGVVRRYLGDTSSILTLTINVIDGANGIFTVNINKTDLKTISNLQTAYYVYDILIIYSGGSTDNLMQGQFIVNTGISQ